VSNQTLEAREVNVMLVFENAASEPVRKVLIDIGGLRYSVEEGFLNLKLREGVYPLKLICGKCIISIGNLDVRENGEYKVILPLYKVRLIFHDTLGNPVKGLSVKLSGGCGSFSGVTGDEGWVEFKNVPLGSYELVYDGVSKILEVEGDVELELKVSKSIPVWVWYVVVVVVAIVAYVVVKRVFSRKSTQSVEEDF